MKKTESCHENKGKAYLKPHLTRYKLPYTGIETYQQPSGTRSSINCQSGRCGGASAPMDIPPWLMP
ncbi:MAG: hypothetical protein AAB229_04830 [Candidatus Hydrogenedentota bacterium]